MADLRAQIGDLATRIGALEVAMVDHAAWCTAFSEAVTGAAAVLGQLRHFDPALTSAAAEAAPRRRKEGGEPGSRGKEPRGDSSRTG